MAVMRSSRRHSKLCEKHPESARRVSLIGALEHQVFEEVGDAGLADRIIGGAVAVPDHVGRHATRTWSVPARARPTERGWGNREDARPGRAGGRGAEGRRSKMSNSRSWRLCRAYVPSNTERDCTRPVLANLWPVRSPGLLSRRASGRMSPAAATALGPNTSKRCWNPSDQLDYIFKIGNYASQAKSIPPMRKFLSWMPMF